MTYRNEGQKPFNFTTEDKKNLRARSKKADRKYYGIKPMRTKLRPCCPECGRRTACKHRLPANVPKSSDPVLIEQKVNCTYCGTPVLESAKQCYGCGFDPKKPRDKNVKI